MYLLQIRPSAKIHTFSLVIVSLQVILNVCSGARILGVFPTPSYSHQIVYRALMEELAKRGHQLVVMTTDPVKYTDRVYENLTQIDVHDFSYNTWTNFFNFAADGVKDPSPINIVKAFYYIMMDITDKQLSTPEMQKLLKDPNEHFDLCFFEAIIPVMYAFKDRFNCPMILISSLIGVHQNFESVGNPTHPIIYPDVTSPFDHSNLNIWQKTYLIYYNLYYQYAYYYYFLPKYNELAKKHFGPNVRELFVIEKSVDLVFLNYNPIWAGPRPTVPNIIYMGNMHLKPSKPLKSDLSTFLDNSKNGAIYFSLGSNVKSNGLPEGIRRILLEAFQELPYNILWKWEDDKLPGQPSNVFISKWIPQQDVLGHPKVKLFITQGGQQSIEEAIYNKVPMIGIPFMADQMSNVIKIVKHGIGKKFLIEDITKDGFKMAIRDVMENPGYLTNMTKLNHLMYDQPQTVLERTVWWTEYVIRHKGARHLRSPSADVSMFEYLMLDIIIYLLAYCLAIILSILVAVYVIYRYYKYYLISKEYKEKPE